MTSATGSVRWSVSPLVRSLISGGCDGNVKEISDDKFFVGETDSIVLSFVSRTCGANFSQSIHGGPGIWIHDCKVKKCSFPPGFGVHFLDETRQFLQCCIQPSVKNKISKECLCGNNQKKIYNPPFKKLLVNKYLCTVLDTINIHSENSNLIFYFDIYHLYYL